MPGHKLEGVATAKCELAAEATAPEAAPIFSKLGSCAKMDCGAVKVPENAELQGSATATLLGAEAAVVCKAGYEAVPGKAGTKMTCAATEAGDDVAWIGELACQPVSCPAEKPAIENGQLADCDWEKKFGEKCALKCDAGYEVVAGDGSFECGANKAWKVGGKCEATTTCAAPVLGERMTGTSCATGEEVLSDAKCSVTCAAGYEATGDFVCHHGAYTSTPACVAAGSEVTTKTFVKGSLALSLNAAGKTAAELEQ